MRDEVRYYLKKRHQIHEICTALGGGALKTYFLNYLERIWSRLTAKEQSGVRARLNAERLVKEIFNV